MVLAMGSWDLGEPSKYSLVREVCLEARLEWVAKYIGVKK